MTEPDRRPDIRALLQAREPKAAATRIVAVDGRGGSGKSTLARLLSTALDAQIIHTDDFASWDNPLDWHADLIARILMPVSEGARSLSYQPSKWWESHHPPPVTAQPVTEVMILEGVSALRREFRDYATLGIFVDTPPDICIRRGVERDLATSKPIAEIEAMWIGWAAEEDRYLIAHDPLGHADIVVEGTRPFGDQLRL